MKIHLYGQSPAMMLLALLLQNESKSAPIDLKLFEQEDKPSLGLWDELYPNFPDASAAWRQSADLWLDAQEALPHGGIVPCRDVGSTGCAGRIVPSFLPSLLRRSLAKLCAQRNIRIVSTVRASNFPVRAGDFSVVSCEPAPTADDVVRLTAAISDAVTEDEIGVATPAGLSSSLCYARLRNRLFVQSTLRDANEYTGSLLWSLAEAHFPTFPQNLNRVVQDGESATHPAVFTVKLDQQHECRRIVIRANAMAHHALAPSIALSAWALIRQGIEEPLVDLPAAGPTSSPDAIADISASKATTLAYLFGG